MIPESPHEFESLCTALDVAFYGHSRDAKRDFGKFVNSSINDALKWYDRKALLALKNFLDTLLERANASDILDKLWRNSKPRVEFFNQSDDSVKKPAILYLFEQVRSAIERKLNEGN